MKSIKLFVVALVCLVSFSACGPKNTPLPVREGTMLGDWIYVGDDTWNNKWYVYSVVELDSSFYIANIKIDLSEESKKNYYLSFVPETDIRTYLFDTALTKFMITSCEVQDSTRKKSFSYRTSDEWEYLRPNTLIYTIAPIAEMLYKDAKMTGPIETGIEGTWGGGKWIKVNRGYYKDDYIETDSSYIVWTYYQYERYGSVFFSPYGLSEGNVRRLAYGNVGLNEILKKRDYFRSVVGSECYVDKYGVPIFECFYDDEWGEFHEGSLVDAVKHALTQRH